MISKKIFFKSLIVILFVFQSGLVHLKAQDSTAKQSVQFVFDNTSILSLKTKDSVQIFAKKFYDESKMQITVFLFSDLPKEFKNPDELGKELALRRGLAQQGMANGVILLIVMKEGFYNILVGKGLEDKVSGPKAQVIIDEILMPSFATKNYETGLIESVRILADLLKGVPEKQPESTYTQPEKQKEAKKENSTGWAGFMYEYWTYFLLVLMVLFGIYYFLLPKKGTPKKDIHERFPDLNQ